MGRYLNFILVFVVALFLNACGGGGGGSDTSSPLTVTLNGVAVDNYIVDATVCIDTNKNNDCSDEAISNRTTTVSNGTFSFSSVTPTDNMVIIAYGGRDADTNETFPYIIKNIATNTDSNDTNGTVVLSSLNTLVTDYKLITNSTLEQAKTDIAEFLEVNATAMVGDIVASGTASPNELVRSLKIFQMIQKINSEANVTNDYNNSANSFKALAMAIQKDANLTHTSNIPITLENNTTVYATIANMKPVFISSSHPSAYENQTSVISLKVIDDNSSLTYSISDTTTFDINTSTGVVTFKSAPNFETNSSYSFVATVSDGTNEANQTVTINILNANESPVFTSDANTSVSENQTNAIDINATDIDGNNVTYSISSGNDANSFDINSSTGVVTFKTTAIPNFETNSSYSFIATVSDGNLTATQTVTIHITDVNDAPVFATSSISTSVNENQIAAITLQATDDDNSSLIYSITDTTNFDINSATGVVTFKTAPNFETNSSYSFIATASDGTSDVNQTVTINILNANEPPEFTSISTVSVNENQTNAIDINATDIDGNALTYSIGGGTNANSFTIESETGIVTFQTAPNFETKSSYSFIATINDGTNDVNQTVTINILNINDAPVFISGTTVSVNENQTNAIDINATDADSNTTLTYSISGDVNSTFNINSATGVVTFKIAPDLETKSSYSFIATVSDGNLTADQNITINLLNANDAPVATLDTFTTNEDTNFTGTLTATDVDNNTVTYEQVGSVLNGTLVVNKTSGSFTYTPTPNYNGPGRFSYKVSDGSLYSLTKDVNITVVSVNDVPVATATSFSISEDTNKSGTLPVATDADNNSSSLQYSLELNATHGTVVVNTNGSYTYSPVANYNGTDSFAYKVFDGINYSTAQTVTITVASVNDAPVFTSSTTSSENENQTNAITLSATDVDNDTLTYSISGGDASLFNINGGVVTFKNTPDYETKRSYSFTAIVGDTRTTVNQTVTINVMNLNDVLPHFQAGASTTIAVDANQTAAITLLATDEDNLTSLTYSISGTDVESFDINSSTGVVTFKVAPENNTSKSSYAFTATVNDGDVMHDQNQSVSILVNSINLNAPVFDNNVSYVLTKDENTTLTAITLHATDPDNNTTVVAYRLVTGGDASSFDINSSTGVVKFTTLPDFESTKTSYAFIVTASDENNNTAYKNISVAINNLNDSTPVITSSTSASVNENQINAITITATDADNLIPLIYSISGTDANSFDINSSTGVVAFKTTAIPNYETKSSYSFTVKVSDGNTSHDQTQSVTIAIYNTNEAPVATYSAVISTNEDTTKTGITLTGSDVDGNSLTYSKVADALHGTVTIQSSGSFSYAPTTANYNGADSFSYKVNDGSLDSAVKDVNITVTSVNDAPVATFDSFATNEDTNFTGTLTATDVDGDTLTYAKVGNVSHGTLTVNENGSFVYSPTANYNGTDSFTYQAKDGNNSLSSAKTVSITINVVNDIPVATFNSLSTNEDTNSTGQLTATDNDVNSTLKYSKVAEPSHGTLTVNENGSFVYSPTANYKGTDNFSYKVNDGIADSATKDVNITVVSVNDTPVFEVADYNVTVFEKQTGAIDVNATDIDGDVLTYRIDSNEASFFDINSSTGVVTFKTAPDYGHAPYQFTVYAKDGNNSEVSQIVFITVQNINEAPVATYNTLVSTNEDTNKTGTLTATDVDNNASSITYLKVTDTTHGTLDINTSTGAFTYSPAANYYGTDSFSYKVKDTALYSAVKDVNITVTSANDAPVFEAVDYNVTVFEHQKNAIDVNATDVDGDILTYRIDSNEASSFDINSSTGVVTFKPDKIPNYSASTNNRYQFTVYAKDGNNSEPYKVVFITVQNVNEAPAFLTPSVTATVNENQISAIGIDASDPDQNTTLTYSISGTDASPFDINSSSGVVTFKTTAIPNFEVKNVYVFKATVSDGNLTADQNVTINIKNINEPATFTLGDSNNTRKQNETFIYDVNITEPDENNLTFVSLVVADNKPCSLMTQNIDGNSTKQMKIHFECTLNDNDVGTKKFTITVNEKNIETNATIVHTNIVDLNVTDVNDKPFTSTTITDVNVSFDSNKTFNFTIADGDKVPSQDVNLTVVSSNTAIATATVTNGINNTGTITVTLYGKELGDSNITVTMKDNGGTANGGIDTASFTFKATVRANGLKLYKNQKDSNYTNSSVLFDGNTYTWDSVNRWYATDETNVSLEKVLMPVKVLDANNISANMAKVDDGHYYVLKSNYINADRNTTTSARSVDATYPLASGGSDRNTTKSEYSQHDPVHHLFVSRTSAAVMAYTTAVTATQSFGNSPESNTTYGTDVNVSIAYANKNVQIDANNTGTGIQYCATTYGEGWRVPTSYEVGAGISNTTTARGYYGFIPAYTGVETYKILTSTKYSTDNTKIWAFDIKEGGALESPLTTTVYVRCVYGIF